MAIKDDEQDLPPTARIYRRPAKKSYTEPVSFNLHKLRQETAPTLKASGWQDDPDVVGIVSKIARGDTFKEGIFDGLNFSGAKLQKPVMTHSSFVESKFIATDMALADFNHSDFTDADLTGANLAGANLSYCDFTGANLSGANLDNADLTGAKIDFITFSEDTGFDGVIGEAELQKTVDKIIALQEAAERGEIDLRSLGIVDLRKLDLRSIDLKGVYLKDKDLKGRLSGVNLSGAIINESDILGADVNMLHFWMQNMNEHNERMDNKALQKRQKEDTASDNRQKEEDKLALKMRQIEEQKEKRSLFSRNRVTIRKPRVRVKPIKGQIIS